ncbi:unnamed protein product [Clonostachys solani]|uniref:Uncharacterized protein n=1 Tax=Clonostachys solani TaxID=160281 RepID=A0A9N9ZFB8_9HYPO|nr:unnamed protein product [Clonostachys solani]
MLMFSTARRRPSRPMALSTNAERRHVIIINFDRAILRPPLKHYQLSAVSRTKRQHRVENLKIHSQKRRKRSLPLNRSQFTHLMSR